MTSMESAAAVLLPLLVWMLSAILALSATRGLMRCREAAVEQVFCAWIGSAPGSNPPVSTSVEDAPTSDYRSTMFSYHGNATVESVAHALRHRSAVRTTASHIYSDGAALLDKRRATALIQLAAGALAADESAVNTEWRRRFLRSNIVHFHTFALLTGLFSGLGAVAALIVGSDASSGNSFRRMVVTVPVYTFYSTIGALAHLLIKFVVQVKARGFTAVFGFRVMLFIIWLVFVLSFAEAIIVMNFTLNTAVFDGFVEVASMVISAALGVVCVALQFAIRGRLPQTVLAFSAVACGMKLILTVPEIQDYLSGDADWLPSGAFVAVWLVVLVWPILCAELYVAIRGRKDFGFDL